MSRYPAVLAAIGLALALTACGEAGDPDRETAGQKLADAFSPAAQAAVPPAQSAQAFANMVAASDAYELASANLARQLGRSDDVKSFARQMIQDHTVVADELRDALKRTPALAANPQMTSAQQHELDELRGAGGHFDNTYAKQQIAAHEQELSAVRDYADNGMDPALSEFAGDAVNMVADHLSLARKLS